MLPDRAMGAMSAPAKLTWPTVALTCVACTGGLLFGYDTGVVSGAMLLLASKRSECSRYGGFGLSSFKQEVVVDATVGGAVLGAAIASWMADRMGRRFSLRIAAVGFTAASALMAMAQGFQVLVVGRVLAGLAIGLASHSVPLYLSECAHPALRGRIVGCFNLFVVFGQVLAGAVDGGFFYFQDGWRYMLGFAGVFSVAQLLGLACLPQSPRWLLQNGQDEEAGRVLFKLRGFDDDGAEIAEIKDAIQREAGATMSYVELISEPGIRRALVLGCGLQALQQFIGINTVMYYSATILREAGFGGNGSGGICCCDDDVTPIWLSVGVSSAQFFGILIGQFLADSTGRRPLVMTSCAGAAVSLGVLGLGFALPGNGATGRILAMAGLISYLVAFGWGMASVPWTINGEIYPLAARAKCIGLSTMTNWITNFAVAGTFLTLTQSPLRAGGTFWLFGAIAMCGLAWTGGYMPETKGKTLGEISAMFHNLAGRRDGRSYSMVADLPSALPSVVGSAAGTATAGTATLERESKGIGLPGRANGRFLRGDTADSRDSINRHLGWS